MRHVFTSSIMVVVLAAALTLMHVEGASAQLTAKANHDHITIDFMYNGSEVTVRGVSDPDVDLAVKITSPEGKQELKQKGKVGGLLWMNVGSLELDNTPNLYFLQCTRKPEEIVPGVAVHYASAFQEGESAYGVLVKTREGRPIFIELAKYSLFTPQVPSWPEQRSTMVTLAPASCSASRVLLPMFCTRWWHGTW